MDMLENVSKEDEVKAEKFLSDYFNSSFIVTLVLSLLKVIGIVKTQWLWITCLLWIPYALFLGACSLFSAISYILFVLFQFSSFVKHHVKNCLGIKGD